MLHRSAPALILYQTWVDWCGDTNVAGASKVGSSQIRFRKVLWFLIFVGGLAATIVTAVHVIQDYRQYDVTTTVSLKKHNTLKFPSVTVCNQNLVDCGQLESVLQACEANQTLCEVAVKDVDYEDVVQILNGLYLMGGCNSGGPGEGNKDDAKSGDKSSGGGGNVDGRSDEAKPGDKASDGDVDSKGEDSTKPGDKPSDSDTNVDDGQQKDGNTNEKDEQMDSNAGPQDKTNTEGEDSDKSSVDSGSESSTNDTDSGPPDNTQNCESGTEDLTKFMKFLMIFNETSRVKLGHSFDSFVQACVYKDTDCHNGSHFVVNNLPSHGNCYTFNSATTHDDPKGGKRVSALTGPLYGLTLVLNIMQDNYIGNCMIQQAGATVVVHKNHDFPLVDDFGILIKPGVSTSLAVKETHISRQSEPFKSHCVDNWEGNRYLKYIPRHNGDIKPGWNYSLPLCQRLCLFSTFKRQCGCSHPRYMDDDAQKAEEPPCDFSSSDNSSDYGCLLRVHADMDAKKILCDCKPACHDTNYDLTPSYSLFPSDKYDDQANDLYNSEGTTESDNLIRLQVYFSDLDVETVSEYPVYENWYSNEFISAFGGAMSLYLGISIAMMFELVEFFIHLIGNTHDYFNDGPKAFAKRSTGSN